MTSAGCQHASSSASAPLISSKPCSCRRSAHLHAASVDTNDCSKGCLRVPASDARRGGQLPGNGVCISRKFGTFSLPSLPVVLSSFSRKLLVLGSLQMPARSVAAMPAPVAQSWIFACRVQLRHWHFVRTKTERSRCPQYWWRRRTRHWPTSRAPTAGCGRLQT